MLRIALLIIALIFAEFAWCAQGPAPSNSKSGGQNQEVPSKGQSQCGPNIKCSDSIPLVVQVSPSWSANNQAENKGTDKDDDAAPEWVTAGATALLSLTSIALAIFTYLLWRANRQLILSAERTAGEQIAQATRTATAMEGASIAMAATAKSAQNNVEIGTKIAKRQKKFGKIQLKAYVLVHTINISNIANPTPEVEAQIPIPANNQARRVLPTYGPITHITIRNSGNTPAKDVFHAANMVYREYPYNPEIPLPTLDESAGSKMLITPGSVTTRFFRFPRPLTDPEIESLRSGTHALYVYGHIAYKDEFGSNRWTKYCFFHNEATGGVGITTDMTGYHSGNEYE